MADMNSPEHAIDMEMQAAYKQTTTGILLKQFEDQALTVYHKAIDDGKSKDEAEREYWNFCKNYKHEYPHKDRRVRS